MSDNYVVMIIVMVIWVAVFGYMMYLDREVKAVNERVKRITEEQGRN